MNYQQQGTPPVQTPQFQAPQYTAPYTAPTQQPQAQPGPQGQAAQSGPAPVRGSLGQGWDQGARSGGHGPAAKFDAQGTIFEGFVARDMTDNDCRQAREPSKDGTGALKFFRKSGQPQFEYVVAVNVQPGPVYTDGKATLFTSKYRLHSAVIRAMQEQNYQPGEGLREGDYIWVQRIGDVNSGMGQPGHDFVAKITRRENLGGGGGQVQAAAPVPETRVEYSAPVAQAPAYGDGNYQVDPTPTAPTVSSASPAPTNSQGLSPEQIALVQQYGGRLPQS